MCSLHRTHNNPQPPRSGLQQKAAPLASRRCRQVCQRELLALFDGFTEIQENELPEKLIALVIREDGFHEIKHDGFRIIKMKNPSAPAVKREAEEDWSKEKWR